MTHHNRDHPHRDRLHRLARTAAQAAFRSTVTAAGFTGCSLRAVPAPFKGTELMEMRFAARWDVLQWSDRRLDTVLDSGR
ncbi:hypothetical protein [Actinomadura litoris]|uniref:Uncharacterized protein n=1 Tax=Actinomadura litoris TaxID=2678616 RepID=A0A7K1LB80_9ACTN|nr:hypothetical protein [Actinomadura litoris]MUN41680.1 hypothetical protein [Actinomadura litoris]